MQIAGMAAIVTGGAAGLGGATARLLAERGAAVTIFDVKDDAGRAQAEAIGARYAHVDVTREDEIEAALAAAADAHGVARILVNCAGILGAARVVGRGNAPHPLDLFRRVVEVNLVGSFAMVSRFAARLAAAEPVGEERGVIVNTASIAAFEGQVGQASYAASKGGIVGLTLPVARDLAPHRIRVMAIAPGIFATPMMEGLPREARDGLGAQVPHPARLGRPEEYAQLVEAIIANPMLNGDVIRLDGAVRMAAR